MKNRCVFEFKRAIMEVALDLVAQFDARGEAENPWTIIAPRIKQTTAENIGNQSRDDDTYIRHGGVEGEPAALNNLSHLNQTQLRLVAIGVAKRLASSLEYMRQEFNIYPNNTKQAMHSSRLKMFTEQAMRTFADTNDKVNDLESQLKEFPPSVRELLQGSMINSRFVWKLFEDASRSWQRES